VVVAGFAAGPQPFRNGTGWGLTYRKHNQTNVYKIDVCRTSDSKIIGFVLWRYYKKHEESLLAKVEREMVRQGVARGAGPPKPKLDTPRRHAAWRVAGLRGQ
jgi:hypothetical protein